ncbi:MAG: hypothetical protein PSX80_05365 [bacterium]|nr:hypothetical protein [bacterium]
MRSLARNSLGNWTKKRYQTGPPAAAPTWYSSFSHLRTGTHLHEGGVKALQWFIYYNDTTANAAGVTERKENSLEIICRRIKQ